MKKNYIPGSKVDLECTTIKNKKQKVNNEDIIEYPESDYLLDAKKYRLKLADSGLNSICRAIVLDWLIGVHRKFQFRPATLYISINLFDRFIINSTKGLINCDNLQLVGATCLHVASKYEDMNPAVLMDYCIMSNSEFQPKDMIEMEANILNSLQFKIIDGLSVLDYIDYFLKPLYNDKTVNLLSTSYYSCATYITELALLHPTLIFFPVSLISISIIIFLCIVYSNGCKDELVNNTFKQIKNKVLAYAKQNNLVKNIKPCIHIITGIIKEQFFLEKKVKISDSSEISYQCQKDLPFIFLKDLTSKWKNTYRALFHRISTIKR
ncbi:hypothetical protein cand_028410 [Cryptosporidium andersoni]|uniref:Cyclin-like domain-containing protein n=1 Tax=Cryptosporidium andersoni TaxID=117008 RepID=A0A1J4MT97_9CRYT|nr:hypothetical protein cand_028410 [Cryptosporidium andersoni]